MSIFGGSKIDKWLHSLLETAPHPKDSAAMALCVTCQKPLTLYIEPDAEDEDESMGNESSANAGSYVDDDVRLQCGCHFHWQCIMDSYSVNECPHCGRNIMTSMENGEQQLLCDLKNEGGLQEKLDILPILTEETYLKAYPEERRCRALLEFCGEGDVGAIVDLLNDEEDEGADGEVRSGSGVDVLRYQDQIGSMGTALHVAVQNGKEEVAWLLLFLASNLEFDQFSPDLLRAAQGLGLEREDQSGKTDIRALEDSKGRTAEQLAHGVSGIWDAWLQSNRLKPPGT